MKQMLLNLIPSPAEAIAQWWQRDEANSYDKLFLVLLVLVLCCRHYYGYQRFSACGRAFAR